jgi:hypothetical protein
LQEGCQYSSQPVLQQWGNNATSSRFRHQASNVINQFQEGCQYSSQPAEVVKKGQPFPGSATRQVIDQLQEGCQYSFQTVLQQWWNNATISGSATRQVNN